MKAPRKVERNFRGSGARVRERQEKARREGKGSKPEAPVRSRRLCPRPLTLARGLKKSAQLVLRQLADEVAARQALPLAPDGDPDDAGQGGEDGVALGVAQL